MERVPEDSLHLLHARGGIVGVGVGDRRGGIGTELVVESLGVSFIDLG